MRQPPRQKMLSPSQRLLESAGSNAFPLPGKRCAGEAPPRPQPRSRFPNPPPAIPPSLRPHRARPGVAEATGLSVAKATGLSVAKATG